MSNPGNDQISVVAQALLNYLKQHPGCADTKEGIVRWWVLERHLKEQMAIVEAALNSLVQRGLVEKYDLHGRNIYRAAHAGESHG